MGLKGLILGDIAGSCYENNSKKRPGRYDKYDLFGKSSRFSDDTIMGIATYRAAAERRDYGDEYQWYGVMFPNSGYGKAFKQWLTAENPQPYNSYGNGSAMRACALGELYKKDWTKRRVEREAIASAMVTHNHPEGVKGAKVIAVCTWMLERGKGKEAVLKYASEQYPVSQYMYGCNVSTDHYAKSMRFDCSCQNTVPVAIRAFYDTNNFDECMRLVNSMECDTDTIGAMAGCLCESFYGSCTEDDEKLIVQYLDINLLSSLRECGVLKGDYKKALKNKPTYTPAFSEFYDPEYDEELINRLYSGDYTDEEIDAITDSIYFNESFGIPTYVEDLPLPGQLELNLSSYNDNKPKTKESKAKDTKAKDSKAKTPKKPSADEMLNMIRENIKFLSSSYNIDAGEISYDPPQEDGVGAFVYRNDVLAVECDGKIFKQYPDVALL